MGRVERIQYRKGEETFPYDTDEPTYSMDSLEVTVTCPICEESHAHELSASLDRDERVVCPTCESQYYVLPFFGYEDDSSIENQIETQLEHVKQVHPIAQDKQGMLRMVAPQPRFFLLGAVGTALGLVLGTSLLVLFLREGQLSSLSVIAFILFAAAILIALLGTLQSVFVVYYSYGWYREYEYDGSFPEFVESVGNYYHENPYKFDD